jgi:membrane associated rhomboid family serine protease
MASPGPFRRSIYTATCFVFLLLVVQLLDGLLSLDLYRYGVFPRSASGLAGILVAPLIHASWLHALSNTLPLLFLGSMLIYGYPRSRWWALSGIWLLSGLGVWVFARHSYHIGASGLAHGIFFYLFIGGILRRDKRSAALLMLAFYFYGGMLLTVFPRDPAVSFESHLAGALAGSLFAYLFRHWDPKPLRRRYSWEEEEEMEEDEIDTEQDSPNGDKY